MNSIASLQVNPRFQADFSNTVNQLINSINFLEKCIAISRPGNPSSCKDKARSVYRYAYLLYLIVTGKIRELIKARRFAYLSIALGLPTAALFGLSPIAIGLIFLGVLWTYFYFVRLKLVGWVVIVSSLLLLMPFLLNALSYFIQAVFDIEEINAISNSLGVDFKYALMIVVVLLAIAITSLTFAIYSLLNLIKHRVVFK
ncbi:MAG: hypothetical protein QXE81_05750 [Desulfurococcaceae archaeon]